MNDRKTLAGAIQVVAALVIAVTFSSTAAAGNIVHSVHVGGPDVCNGIDLSPGCDANLSLVALQFDDGTVTGRFTDMYFANEGTIGTVTCLRVVNNEAYVSGIRWTYYSDGTREQGSFFIKVIDNGKKATDPPDETSFGLFDREGGTDSCLTFQPSYVWEFPQGQVTVK